MTDHSPRTRATSHPEPGILHLAGPNWRGIYTLYLREVRRFFKVQLQTIWAPALTTLLFLAIFSVALGRQGSEILGLPYTTFLAPGLIIMGMAQNAFANTSTSLLVGKVQGTIVDILLPPLSSTELLVAHIAGGVTRAWLVGAAIWVAMLLWPGVSVTITKPLTVLYFGTMGAMLLGLLGMLTGIWADKYDHAAAVTNFVIQPLTLLSGTFYAIERLAPGFQIFSRLNPFFYMIDGFRSGFIGVHEANVWLGAGIVGAMVIGLWWLIYRLLETGWKLRA